MNGVCCAFRSCWYHERYCSCIVAEILQLSYRPGDSLRILLIGLQEFPRRHIPFRRAIATNTRMNGVCCAFRSCWYNERYFLCIVAFWSSDKDFRSRCHSSPNRRLERAIALFDDLLSVRSLLLNVRVDFRTSRRYGRTPELFESGAGTFVRTFGYMVCVITKVSVQEL